MKQLVLAVVFGTMVGLGRASSNSLEIGDSRVLRPLIFDDQRLGYSPYHIPGWLEQLPTSFRLEHTIVEARTPRLGDQPYVCIEFVNDHLRYNRVAKFHNVGHGIEGNTLTDVPAYTAVSVTVTKYLPTSCVDPPKGDGIATSQARAVPSSQTVKAGSGIGEKSAIIAGTTVSNTAGNKTAVGKAV